MQLVSRHLLRRHRHHLRHRHHRHHRHRILLRHRQPFWLGAR